MYSETLDVNAKALGQSATFPVPANTQSQPVKVYIPGMLWERTHPRLAKILLILTNCVLF